MPGAFSGADDLEAGGAGPVDKLGDQGWLVSVCHRHDDPGLSSESKLEIREEKNIMGRRNKTETHLLGLSVDIRTGKHVAFDVDQYDVRLLLARKESMADADHGVSGGLSTNSKISGSKIRRRRWEICSLRLPA
jgi:hypothetical protein